MDLVKTVKEKPPVIDRSSWRAEQPAYGILLVNKPAGITTFDIIRRIKRHRRRIKAGHAGTLDPFATGLVLLAIGRATRTIQHLQALTKVYEGTIRLGAVTPSLDPDTPVERTAPVPALSLEQAQQIADTFQGTVMQMPPIYSALKVGGKRAYDLARQGKTPELKPRPVRIDRFVIKDIQLPEVAFRLECGKGTYARAVARDFAEKAGTLGHLTTLVRTAIGPYSIEQAFSLTELENLLRTHPHFLKT